MVSNEMTKVLIFKTGRSETFAPGENAAPSLGDVLRTTVLLNLFQNTRLTWVTSPEAAPLLRSNRLIDAVRTDQEFLNDPGGEFDVIVNLERDRRLVSWFREARAQEKYGFISDREIVRGKAGGSVEPYTALSAGQTWQEGLYRVLDRHWQGEEYVFGSASASSAPILHDVGLNWAVGPKWPSKAWRQESWMSLHERISKTHSVSWQTGFDSLETYSAWIASCRFLITTDSLGLHLAVAMRKKVVSFFGPTPAEQVYLYGRGAALTADPERFPCAPCWEPRCPKNVTCMDVLSVNEVYSAFISLCDEMKDHAITERV